MEMQNLTYGLKPVPFKTRYAEEFFNKLPGARGIDGFVFAIAGAVS
jgi:hypothetical protein